MATSQPTQPPWLLGFYFYFFLSFFLFYFTNKYCYSSMYMQRRQRCQTHQHNHLTWRPSTTTAMSQPTQPPRVVGFFLFLFSFFYLFLFIFYFTNKYCYSSMYMQWWLRRLTHQHKPPYTATINDDGHVTAKTTTARQPPYIATINNDGHVTANATALISRFLFLFIFSCFILLIRIATVLCTCNNDSWPIDSTTLHTDHRRLQRLATSLRRLESATAASNSQVANGTQAANGLKSSWPQPQYNHNYHMQRWNVSPPFFFFLFCFCFYTLYLYKQYTNWLPHDKLTTTTSSRNSNSNRMPATAGTTVTRIPAADAAAEVVAAAAAATWVLFIYFFFLKFFFFWQLRASNSRLKVARRLYSVWCFGFYFFSPFFFCPLN